MSGQPVGWWASEERWFNRDGPTRVVLVVVWAAAVLLAELERAVGRLVRRAS